MTLILLGPGNQPLDLGNVPPCCALILGCSRKDKEGAVEVVTNESRDARVLVPDTMGTNSPECDRPPRASDSGTGRTKPRVSGWAGLSP